ncbi:protoporphyrinogen oxidase [Monomorium pharaonis]|uniref:protoporphyrinogen oxidase n=1 Tax=Monomorium pharaonis TaxID=307658 RepID=UPI00063FA0E7|nr:protoporphyrinogen oxidase [Monomorium pharaonis]XP_012525492.1 protoporphyrinogen oxidase [Monomorium pharaonis]XP_012525494.1 protoporphyrinogen oxidase [Monomorium pharaonis]XP_012525497.1 protoporphyrinogen oxidase [Monomorium pharaonis]XP_012525499.1 protoporphyrinogen oxidase [Monomorium pharaonis]XP_012525500.1 protoporphyrinogen oxidase [Monomorium pharaonis]XP_028047721.1 protoporphyrinogen oxidase [Monomorium pharaonis]
MTVILGGGISGLSAAYYALNDVRLSSVVLLEASNRLGGWICSRRSPSGAIFEQGPRTVRIADSGKNTLNLVEDLQLSDKLIHIGSHHHAVANRLIYTEDALHRVPTSIATLFKTPSLLDRPLINRIWTDLRAPRVPKEDESIYSFVQRRLGQDIADNLISPMICGICAGDAREISVNFLFKSLFEAEQKHGSIVKGLLINWLKKVFSKPEGEKDNVSKRKDNANDESTARSLTLAERAQKEHWVLWGLQGGLEQLPQTLADNLSKRGVNIQTEKRCEKLMFKPDRVELLVNGEPQECSRVISSLRAKDLAELLQEQHPTLSAELKAIPTVTVGVVNLEFQENVLPLQAFGFLVPPKENLPLLGVIFDSCVFPGSSTVLTVMMGGAWFEKYFGKNPSEEQLLMMAIYHTKNILQIEEEPVAHNVAILKDCIPQHIVGHNARVKRIHNYISTHRIPLALCGSSYQGVGLNDVILSAKQAVRDVVK